MDNKAYCLWLDRRPPTKEAWYDGNAFSFQQLNCNLRTLFACIIHNGIWTQQRQYSAIPPPNVIVNIIVIIMSNFIRQS